MSRATLIFMASKTGRNLHQSQRGLQAFPPTERLTLPDLKGACWARTDFSHAPDATDRRGVAYVHPKMEHDLTVAGAVLPETALNPERAFLLRHIGFDRAIVRAE